jgi:hypothetical protein
MQLGVGRRQGCPRGCARKRRTDDNHRKATSPLDLSNTMNEQSPNLRDAVLTMEIGMDYHPTATFASEERS